MDRTKHGWAARRATRAHGAAERATSMALRVLALVAAGCTGTLDAGSTRPHGLLPVDERNPMVLVNDNAYENWQGEYAVLLANGGGPKLAGIIVGTGGIWTNIDDNVAGWTALVAAARNSGLQGIPDPIKSVSAPLGRPNTGIIEETQANRSEGANFIVNKSKEVGLAYRPMVVATGGRLTDVADAYLIDPTVTDRVVVVSSLGTLSSTGGVMGPPNGEMDPWADTIVTARFRYVQVSAFYDQLTDVPASRLAELPNNPFGSWIKTKQPGIWNLPVAADQVAVAAVGIPKFVTAVEQVSVAGPSAVGATSGPDLTAHPAGSPTGSLWLVTASAGSAATDRLWGLLLSSTTFAH